MNTRSDKTLRIISGLEFFIAVGIVFFWIGFFALGFSDLSDSELKDIYLAFEGSFPAADGLLALFLVCGGIGLLRKASSGWFFTLMAGAMLIFLGLLDVSFNSRQGIYWLGPGEAVLNIGINAICLAGGGFLTWSAWKNWFRPFPKNSDGGLS
ncbi:MAG: hypothetical protein AB1715_04005 [Acidobacteriota bacterium]